MEPSRYKSICLPFESEAQYHMCVEDPAMFRQHIESVLTHHSELFPEAMPLGFRLHDQYWSVKQHVGLRRIKVTATGQVFQIRPSFVLPYMVVRTEEVEKASYRRQWGVPFDALAYVFGRDPMFWYRVWVAVGQASVVGATVKTADQLPVHLAVDEKHTWVGAEKVYVPTTVAHECILGVTVVTDASTEALTEGYGELVAEARHMDADYCPQTVCADGWKATREAWMRLVPTITIILCFLHSVLKIQDRCREALRHTLTEKAWHVYHATTKSQFAQRLRRLREWATAHLTDGPVRHVVLRLCHYKPRFIQAYDFPRAHRTSNAVDRLLNQVDRLLYQMRYFHASTARARLALRAIALLWNLHPYGCRLRRRETTRVSPFVDLNGFQYHTNWLPNLLIASSMGGWKL